MANRQDWVMTSWARVRAPVRILDAGGWTDTWFAGHGTVCHLAVDDGVEVSVRRRPSPPGRSPTVDLSVPDFGDRYRFHVDHCPRRHPLLEAALRRWASPDSDLDVTVTSAVPPASGLGTSAAVVVAMIAGLQALSGELGEPAVLARAAHEIETIDLGLQSGVQDQLAAAYGGCNLISIEPYPDAEVRAVDLVPAAWEALRRRVVTIYLGAPHHSSTIHERVIDHLATSDGQRLLEPLRAAAQQAALALAEGNIEAYGQAMTANTAAQAALHPALVSPAAHRVIGIAENHGAAGWKVNGAGGEGGTVTVVGPDAPGELISALEHLDGSSVIPLRPARLGARIIDRG